MDHPTRVKRSIDRGEVGGSNPSRSTLFFNMESIVLTLHPDHNFGAANRHSMIPVNNFAYAKDTANGTQIFFKRCTFQETTLIVKESAYEIHKMFEEFRKNK